jgi:hypothetical protein
MAGVSVRARVWALVVASGALALSWACGSTPPAEPRPAASRDEAPASQAPRDPAPPPSAPVGDDAVPAPRGPRRVVIGGSGDVLAHLKVVRSAREHADVGGFLHVFGELREVIGQDEVAVVNLETPLSERVPPETGNPPVLGAPAEVADALAAAGVDVAAVANNHAYDQTALGVEDTLRALEAAGVHAIGAAARPEAAPGPAIVERGGVRVALLAFTERVNRGPGSPTHRGHVARFARETAGPAIAAARAQADVVVVSIHWSHDFRERPMPHQRENARWMVEQGVDVILGHGPHVLQEVERIPSPRGEAVCAYSLGNLVSNQALRYRLGRRAPTTVHPAVVLPTTRDGAWLRVRLAVHEGAVRVEAVEAVPLWTHNNFLRALEERVEPRLDIRIRPLRNAEPEVQAERRPAIERALGPAVALVD